MDVFSAIAQPTRRSILELLATRGRLSSTDISDRFRLSPPAISQHLKVLRMARLVRMQKRAQQHIYEINREGMAELEHWTRQMTALWNERFDALEMLLKEEESKQPKHRSRKGKPHGKTK